MNVNKVDVMEIAVFNALGVWPLIAFAFLFRDPRSLFFLCASFFGGMFALLPYLIFFRKDANNRVERPTDVFEKSTQYVSMIAIIGLLLVVYAVSLGSVQRFKSAFWTKPFTHVMSVDFLCFWIASADWIRVDCSRSSVLRPYRFVAMSFALIPIVGPSFYLLWAKNMIDFVDAEVVQDSRRKKNA